jgi:hypothetical protein
MSQGEIESLLNTHAAMAEAVRTKTGGHPQLTSRLLGVTERDMKKLGEKYADFAKAQRRFLLQLVDDHGSAAGKVLADLMSASRDAWVSESSILSRHFGGATTLGLDMLDDLAASGLIARNQDSCRLGAEILRTDRDLGPHLAAPPFAVIDEPSVEFGEAATQLFRVENRLRRVVGNALGEVEETWWPSRIPPTLVREVEQARRAEEESPAPPASEVHPIAYLSLGELFEVMLEDANWQQVFRIRLGITRDAFSQTAASLRAIRNKVAHNRPVTADDLTVLRMATERLGV